MSRRFHKKSRNGCLECKKRRVKCDENRPACVNCDTAELRCSFLNKTTVQIVPVLPSGQQPHWKASTAASTNDSTPTYTTPGPEYETELERSIIDPYSVNVTHITLFNNLSNPELLALEHFADQPDVIPSTVYITYALTSPYLMHQLLAASALHLSITTKAELRSFYRAYATGLQSRALTLFNQTHPILQVTSSNCAHLFLFSSLVGVHLLSDTLHNQASNLDSFLIHFTHCLNVYRGVLAIIDEAWDHLQETELGPV